MGSKVHLAVDTLGHLLALRVTPANGGDRTIVEELGQAVQEVTGDAVQLAWVDQGYTGQEAAQAAAKSGIKLMVVKLQEAKRGFVLVLLPRQWVVERSSPGLPASGVWLKTVNGFLKPWRASTSSRSPLLCLPTAPRCFRVTNTL